MADSPAISVVIPCFNGAQYLGEAIQSALTQTYPPVEIIVVDDGSEDNSAEIAESFGPPVRVLRQANSGESVARNKAWELTTGDWIALLDADDRWLPEKLARQIALIDAGVVAIHTPYRTFGVSADIVDRSHIPAEVRYTPEYLSVHSFICPSSLLVRRDVKARFPTWTRYGEDKLFCLDLFREGSFRMTEQILTEVRKHPTNQSGSQAVEIEWHGTMLQWLELHASELRPAQIEQIKRGWRGRLVRAAMLAWRRGDRAEFQAYRSYIQQSGSFYRPFCRLGISHAWAGIKQALGVRR